MRVDTASEHNIAITLSKRNLLALLGKVDDPHSHKTIVIFNNNCALTVVAEPDDLHYRDRRRGTGGRMVDGTETFIAANQSRNFHKELETEHVD